MYDMSLKLLKVKNIFGGADIGPHPLSPLS
jgi:hypothetical protein